jgi:hypothetical protein
LKEAHDRKSPYRYAPKTTSIAEFAKPKVYRETKKRGKGKKKFWKERNERLAWQLKQAARSEALAADGIVLFSWPRSG